MIFNVQYYQQLKKYSWPVKLNQTKKQLRMDRKSKEINLTKPTPEVKTEQVLSLKYHIWKTINIPHEHKHLTFLK